MRRTTPLRRATGTALIVAAVCFAYLAANDVAPEYTVPLLVLTIFGILFNGAYHGSKY